MFLVLRPVPCFGESETQSKKGSEEEDIDFVDLQCVPKLIRHRQNSSLGPKLVGPWFCQSQYTPVVDISVDAEAQVSDVQSPLTQQTVVCCCFGLYEQDTYRDTLKSMPDQGDH